MNRPPERIRAAPEQPPLDPAKGAGESGLSAFIVCQNEVSRIGACLDSVRFCDEIVVVDSGSTDGTIAVIEECRATGMPIRLIAHPWQGFAPQKQFALEQCRGRWCLNLDADERIDKPLAAEILRTIASGPEEAGFRLPLRNWLPGYGYAHPATARDLKMRLVRRDLARYDLGLAIHERLLLDGRTGRLREGSLLHRPDLSPEQELEKQNRYTSLKAAQRFEQGKRPRPLRMLTSPLGYFLKHYLLKRYFLCGWAGVATSMISAQYGFQTEFKHWRLCRNAAAQDHSER
jgi:glycosyltransferase involved in cell wall biosynthesis